MLIRSRLIKQISFAVVAGFSVIASSSCSPGQAHQAGPAPRLEFTGYVVDQAGVLSPEVSRSLTDRLGRFEYQTKHQFAVVTVTTLGGEDVGAFTDRLANRWGVGRKGVDDGIVLLVAPKDRRVRISVGDGLRRELPNSFCQQVIDRDMVPAFARGQIELGIDVGVSAIMARVIAYSEGES